MSSVWNRQGEKYVKLTGRHFVPLRYSVMCAGKIRTSNLHRDRELWPWFSQGRCEIKTNEVMVRGGGGGGGG